jgi:hypothetical protein
MTYTDFLWLCLITLNTLAIIALEWRIRKLENKLRA